MTLEPIPVPPADNQATEPELWQQALTRLEAAEIAYVAYCLAQENWRRATSEARLWMPLPDFAARRRWRRNQPDRAEPEANGLESLLTCLRPYDYLQQSHYQQARQMIQNAAPGALPPLTLPARLELLKQSELRSTALGLDWFHTHYQQNFPRNLPPPQVGLEVPEDPPQTPQLVLLWSGHNGELRCSIDLDSLQTQARLRREQPDQEKTHTLELSQPDGWQRLVQLLETARL